MKLVSQMHREIFDSHQKFVKAYNGRPEAVEARESSLWPAFCLSDPEGMRLSKDLLKNYMDLRTHSRDEELLANCRAYVARRGEVALKTSIDLRKANETDPERHNVLTRNAMIPLFEEESAIAKTCLAKIDALAR